MTAGWVGASALTAHAQCEAPDPDDPWLAQAEARLAERSAQGAEAVHWFEAALAQSPRSEHRVQALLRARHYWAESDPEVHQNEYATSVDLGLAWLATCSVTLGFDRFEHLAARVEQVPAHAHGVLYWTALAFGRTIRDRSIFARPGAAADFRRVMVHLSRRSPDLFFGGPLRVLATYEARSPGFLGGSKERAMERALEALRRHPEYAGNAWVLARVGTRSGWPDSRVRETLLAASRSWEADLGPAQPEQRRAQARIHRWLRESASP